MGASTQTQHYSRIIGPQSPKVSCPRSHDHALVTGSGFLTEFKLPVEIDNAVPQSGRVFQIRTSGFILSMSNSMEPDYLEELLRHYLGSLLENGSMDVLEEFRLESAF